MRKWMLVAALAVGTAPSVVEAKNCKKGCACGNACISCSKACKVGQAPAYRPPQRAAPVKAARSRGAKVRPPRVVGDSLIGQAWGADCWVAGTIPPDRRTEFASQREAETARFFYFDCPAREPSPPAPTSQPSP